MSIYAIENGPDLDDALCEKCGCSLFAELDDSPLCAECRDEEAGSKRVAVMGVEEARGVRLVHSLQRDPAFLETYLQRRLMGAYGEQGTPTGTRLNRET